MGGENAYKEIFYRYVGSDSLSSKHKQDICTAVQSICMNNIISGRHNTYTGVLSLTIYMNITSRRHDTCTMSCLFYCLHEQHHIKKTWHFYCCPVYFTVYMNNITSTRHDIVLLSLVYMNITLYGLTYFKTKSSALKDI